MFPDRNGQPKRVRGPGRAALALVCAAALLVAPGVAAAQPNAAAQPGGHTDLPDAMPGDRLLVAHGDAADHQLHTVNLDGSDRTVLTSGQPDFAGTWSPDGRHIAFHRVEEGGDGLWVVPSDGGDPRRLADGGHGPSWSPDGTRIVHSPSTEGDPKPLAITALDGTTTRIPGTESGIDPAWSPDGNQIAYVEPRSDFALVLVRMDGTDRTVTAGPASEPAWSPGSDRVAYIEGRGDRRRLMMIDGAGSEQFVLADRFARVQQLAYSPTGAHVAFAAAEQLGDHLDIWTARVDDGNLHRLTDDPVDDLSPTWSASSELVAFTRTPDNTVGDAPRDVHLVPGSGGPARRVTDTGEDDAVAFAPGLTLRMAGQERIATALALSRTFAAADVVVVARADDYPDALAGAPLAATAGGPILLTGGERLHGSLPDELARLGAETVYLLGGHAALSPRIEEDLAAAGIEDTRRLHGPDRFATAVAVADELERLGGEPERLFVAEGQHDDPARGWPDALSASGVAARTGEPILLVTRDRLPPATAAALEARAAARATIVGGTSAVSEAVADRVAERVADLERLSGADRYETSTRAADLAVANGASDVHPWLVTGRDWPDALVAAPALARDEGVLLLVDGRDPVGSAATHAWLPGRDHQRGVVVGGTAAITPRVRAAIESSLVSGP